MAEPKHWTCEVLIDCAAENWNLPQHARPGEEWKFAVCSQFGGARRSCGNILQLINSATQGES